MQAAVEVEALTPTNPQLAATIAAMEERGISIVYGRWLIEGAPRVLLIDTKTAYKFLDEWKADLWNTASIPSPPGDDETNEAVVFGYLVAWFLGEVRIADCGSKRGCANMTTVRRAREGKGRHRPLPRMALGCRPPPLQEAPHRRDDHLHDSRDAARPLPLRRLRRLLQQPAVL